VTHAKCFQTGNAVPGIRRRALTRHYVVAEIMRGGFLPLGPRGIGLFVNKRSD
jgi:hypothetical protein